MDICSRLKTIIFHNRPRDLLTEMFFFFITCSKQDFDIYIRIFTHLCRNLTFRYGIPLEMFLFNFVIDRFPFIVFFKPQRNKTVRFPGFLYLFLDVY